MSESKSSTSESQSVRDDRIHHAFPQISTATDPAEITAALVGLANDHLTRAVAREGAKTLIRQLRAVAPRHADMLLRAARLILIGRDEADSYRLARQIGSICDEEVPS
jgi:hypothetical protein